MDPSGWQARGNPLHLARLAWIAPQAISPLADHSRSSLHHYTRPEPMDSLSDLLPCDPKQVVPLLLAWHQSPPELPDLDRAKHVSIQLQALDWSSEFCDERSGYEPSFIFATYQALERAPWKAVCGNRAGAWSGPTGAVLLRVRSRRVGVQRNEADGSLGGDRSACQVQDVLEDLSGMRHDTSIPRFVPCRWRFCFDTVGGLAPAQVVGPQEWTW